MPATYTHHLFTKDVYKVLNTDTTVKFKDSIDIFNLFGKSFDILFFSNPHLGHKAHNWNSNLYFSNIVNYIKDNELENDSQVLAYLYGSICHYVLDSTIHPYVFYYTGRYNHKIKTTHKYRGLHSYFEYMIDAILYKERNNKDIYKVNLTKEIFPKITFSSNLNNIINDVFLKTFLYNKGLADINKGRKNFKTLMRLGMCSRFGFKKAIIRFIDFLHIFKGSKFANCSYHIKKLDNSVLNIEHEKWCYPVDKKITYHYSFYDLYDIAIERAKMLINELDVALNSDSASLNKVLRKIGNLSYTTGKNINKKDIMKYFKF